MEPDRPALDDVQAVLFDIDGVLTVSWQAIAGAAQAIERVRAHDLRMGFLTNTTGYQRDQIAAMLHEADIPVSEEQIITTPRATAAYLAEHHLGARCLLINEGDIEEELPGVSWVEHDPEVILLGGAGPAFTYERLNVAFQAAVVGVPVVAMHRNTTWQTDQGLQLDTGAYIAGLELAAGIEVTTIGKPSPPMFEAALDDLEVPPDRAVMVGDDLDADVRGAMAAGLAGVLVRTGKHRADPAPHESDQPTAIIDSVADLPHLLGLG